MAPDCEVYSVRVLGSRLTGNGLVFAAGLRWAIDAGMDVINLSLSTSRREYFGLFHELADDALNTLLTEEYLLPTASSIPLVVSGLAGVAVVVAWRRSWWMAAIVTVAAAAGWLLLRRVLAGAECLLDPVRPSLAAVVAFTTLVVSAGVRQVLQRRRLAKLFSQYVPPDVARDLIESGRAETAQAGERLLVSVLFCDLRGFTPTVARLSPADVRELLDRYYETYSQVVFQHGGTVLQYTGIEIFAVFGGPLPRSDHADAALACARGRCRPCGRT